MEPLANQSGFWDEAAVTKQFTHPLDHERLRRVVPANAAILDFGCGQGRLNHELAARGYNDVLGVDFSEEMIRLACERNPAGRFAVSGDLPLAFADASFDCVLLFAVLTCIPSDQSQKNLVSEFKRVLRPGGLLLVSDYPLQVDARNQQRYDQYALEFGVRGTFRLPDGAVVRHHRHEWFAELLSDFEVRETVELDARTMNGNPARICQLWSYRST